MRVGLAVYRAALRLYPPAFRREYEGPLVQSVCDRSRLGGEPAWRVLTGELADVVPTAIRMRRESAMTRTIVALVVLGLCVVAAVSVSPIAAVAVAFAAGALYLGSARPAETVEGSIRRRRAAPWAGVAVVALIGAVAIPLVDGGELSGLWWSMMAVLALGSLASALTAAALSLPR